MARLRGLFEDHSLAVSARLLVYAVACAVVLAGSVAAVMPPSPEAIEQFKRDGIYEEKMERLAAFHQVINERNEQFLPPENGLLSKYGESMAALRDGEVDTQRVVVILVEFPDFKHDDPSYAIPGGGIQPSPAVGTPEMFDSLLFSRQGIDPAYNPTGSMTEFYLENSYGQYLIIGDIVGWVEAPENYSYYVGVDDGGAMGPTLARHAVIAADSLVDFSLYAHGSSMVSVIVVHAGPGAETGAYGVWSHRSMMTSVQTDGVFVNSYTLNPEEYGSNISSMGVFAHEWGHVLSMPDLYDIGGSGGAGIGDFSLMAGGSWNGGGRTPAHFDAYCKVFLGYVTPTPVPTSNLVQVPIPQVETNPLIYMLRQGTSTEFWLVENRQPVGFDVLLPGFGLFVYHVDVAVAYQNNPDRYRVSIEQADGDEDLNEGRNEGDGGDPFPGSENNREFHDYSNPNAHYNLGDLSHAGVWGVTNSDSLMYADLDVTYSRPWLKLEGDSISVTDSIPDGNNDGIVEAGEIGAYHIEFRNWMKQTYNARAMLTVDRPGITFLNNNVRIFFLNPLNPSTLEMPIRFEVDESFLSANVQFTLTITSTENINGTGRIFQNVFTKTIPIGKTQLLVVDDDNGASYQNTLSGAYNRIGMQHDIWNKLSSGSPTGSDLSEYQIVHWLTGRQPNGGTLTAADVTAMQQFLDGGGRLILASEAAVDQLATLDSTFMANYLHVNKTGTYTTQYFRGIESRHIGNGFKYRSLENRVRATMTGVNGGEEAFVFADANGNNNYGVCGVTFDGQYKTVVMSYGLEHVSPLQDFKPVDSILSRILYFCVQGSTTDVEDDGGSVDLLPGSFTLNQNYPNPFNPSTVISYSIAPGELERTQLSVYNLLGQQVTTLVDKVQGPGDYEVVWDGSNADGKKVASGMYFYRLTRGERSEARKMMLVK